MGGFNFYSFSFRRVRKMHVVPRSRRHFNKIRKQEESIPCQFAWGRSEAEEDYKRLSTEPVTIKFRNGGTSESQMEARTVVEMEIVKQAVKQSTILKQEIKEPATSKQPMNQAAVTPTQPMNQPTTAKKPMKQQVTSKQPIRQSVTDKKSETRTTSGTAVDVTMETRQQAVPPPVFISTPGLPKEFPSVFPPASLPDPPGVTESSLSSTEYYAKYWEWLQWYSTWQLWYSRQGKEKQVKKKKKSKETKSDTAPTAIDTDVPIPATPLVLSPKRNILPSKAVNANNFVWYVEIAPAKRKSRKSKDQVAVESADAN